MFLRIPLVVLATLSLFGCTPPGGHLLGNELGAAPEQAVSSLKTTTLPVTLSGTMVEKCPTAGCWFRLQDSTGIVKVQLATADFTVTEVPKGAMVRVFGSYNKEAGELVATGLRW